MHEFSRAPLPRLVEVFDEKTRHHHANAVVHPPFGPKLAHTGVDERESCSPVRPGVEGLLVVYPPHRRVVARVQRCTNRVGPLMQDVGVELTPTDLATKAVIGVCQLGEDRARMDLPVLEVVAHGAGAVEIGPIAALVVGGQVRGVKVRPSFPCRFLARFG